MLELISNDKRLAALLEKVGLGESSPEHAQITDALTALYVTLDSFNLSKDNATTVLNLISTEGKRQLRETESLLNATWQDFDYGNVRLGDYVRVKHDAYPDGSGSRHNGLVGKLKWMNRGKCTVAYIGSAIGNEMNHPKENLESLKRV